MFYMERAVTASLMFLIFLIEKKMLIKMSVF